MLIKTTNINSSLKESVGLHYDQLLGKGNKLGSIYIKCTHRNIFCTLMDTLNKKVKTSCSLRVPSYENEYNERENLYTRGLLLGKLFAEKATSLGYGRVIIYLTGTSRGRSGLIRSLNKSSLDVYSIVLATSKPHNGCRPAKTRRKKFRSRVKGLKA